MKKVVKFLLGFGLFLLLALLLLPVVFKGKIISTLKQKINQQLNAKVEFADASLSLIRNFPSASVKLESVSVINLVPFEGDTLFYGKSINLKISLTDVIKGDQITIKSFEINEANANIVVNKGGIANYDITKKTSGNSDKKIANDEKSRSKSIAIESYEINHLNLVYNDQKGNMIVKLRDFSHSGSGDLSADRTQLTTQTTTGISFLMNNISYADNIHLDLNAVLDLDLKNQKFIFLKNKAHINQLPLIFDGFFQIYNSHKELDVNFKTPSSDFRNFLALVPKKYAKNISDVKTTGDFSINGKINGIMDDKHIPKIDVTIASNNASFKFPSLPKGVQNIHLNTNIKNTTGVLAHTVVNVKNVSFKIDDNEFKANANIGRLTTNPFVEATLKGKLDLADIDKVYPLKMKSLSGLIDANLSAKFDIQAIQKGIAKRVNSNGKVSLANFEFKSKDLVNPLTIKNATIDFKPTLVSLTNFEAKTGKTDVKATGKIDDLLGFLLSNKKLKGSFVLKSNTFKVLDFMKEGSTKDVKTIKKQTTISSEGLKIPDFLDMTTTVNAKKVLYGNLTLMDVTGAMIIKDQKAVLKNIQAGIFDGEITLNGGVNTQEEASVFDMKMGIKNFDIATSFKEMKMLGKLAPISKFIKGKFNTNIAVNGELTKDLTPDLKTIKGDAFAQLLNQHLDPQKSKAMSLLNNELKFIDLKKLNLDDIKAKLSFKDGKVHVKPFKLKYQDIDINIGGSHGFDQSMNYKVSLDVPAKYLGAEVTQLLTKLDSKNRNVKVPITASLTGNFNHPSVKTDLTSSVSNFTKQLVVQQKNKLVNKALNKIIPSNSSSNSKQDSDTKNTIKKGVNDILGGLFGGSKKGK